MEYKGIRLVGDGTSYYDLVRYQNQNDLKNLGELNSEFAVSIQQWLNEEEHAKEYQNYIILKSGLTCVGAISIDASSETEVRAKVKLQETSFSTSQEYANVVSELVNFLGSFFFEKENIVIHLDKSVENLHYTKKVSSSDGVTYVCSNWLYRKLIPKLLEEVIGAEKTLTEWGQYWHQVVEKQYDFITSSGLENAMEHAPTWREIMSQMREISWTGIHSRKSTRKIQFSKNGMVSLSKSGNWNDYQITYHVLGDWFRLTGSQDKWNNKSISIDKNEWSTHIKTEQYEISFVEKEGKKRMRYVSPIIDFSSVALELSINEENEIETCYADFRTHQKNKSVGKINGQYALRISSDKRYGKNRFSICFISRKGDRYADFTHLIAKENEELLSTIMSSTPTMETIERLMECVIPIVNLKAQKEEKQKISEAHSSIFSSWIASEKEAVNYVKNLTEEIPLPHLQENLREFVRISEDRIKGDHKVKILK